MKRVSLPGLLIGVLLVGCSAAPGEDEDEGAAAVGQTSLQFTVFGFGSETKEVEYGTTERVFGTARADDRMEAQMLPGARAKANAVLREACAAVTNGAGRLEGAPGGENVRAERIYRPTEFIVEVRNEQTCSAPRAGMEARAGELVGKLADDQSGSTFRAVVALGEKSVAPTVAAIESRIGRDGKLITTEDNTRSVANWTINHVVFLARVLSDLPSNNARALGVLRRLETAVSASPWAKDEVTRVIGKIQSGR